MECAQHVVSYEKNQLPIGVLKTNKLGIKKKTRNKNNTILHLYRILGLQNALKGSIYIQRYPEGRSHLLNIACACAYMHSDANSCRSAPVEQTRSISSGR